MVYGYARVSTDRQDVDNQARALREYTAAHRLGALTLMEETASGTRTGPSWRLYSTRSTKAIPCWSGSSPGSPVAESGHCSASRSGSGKPEPGSLRPRVT